MDSYNLYECYSTKDGVKEALGRHEFPEREDAEEFAETFTNFDKGRVVFVEQVNYNWEGQEISRKLIF